MGGMVYRYISINEFEAYQKSGKHYEGYVVGLGYAYVGEIDDTTSQLLNFYSEINAQMERRVTSFYENDFRVISLTKYQVLDMSLDAIKQSMRNVPTRAKYHRVQQGETLSMLAARYGVTVTLLQQWNNLHTVIEAVEAGRMLIVAKTAVMVSGSFHFMQGLWDAIVSNQGLWGTMIDNQDVIDKYNRILKNINVPQGVAKDLFEIARKMKLTKWWTRHIPYVGWVTAGADTVLTLAAIDSGQPWGRHAYNATMGFASQLIPHPKVRIVLFITDATVQVAPEARKMAIETNRGFQRWLAKIEQNIKRMSVGQLPGGNFPF
jgi:hypothetical protein